VRGGGGFGGGISRGGGFGYGGYGRGFGYGGYYGGLGYGRYGYGLGWGWGWPGWGYGYPLSDYGYGYPYDYPYDSYGAYGGYAAYPDGGSYQTSPNVVVINPQSNPGYANSVAAERANPVMRQYDQYGQELQPPSGYPSPAGSGADSSPVYLIAFSDHVIRAASAYWVDARTLHYVTLQHEEKQASLDTVDRGLSLQLNRERRVPFQLPAQ
jgi:hypothetical protein